MVLVNSQHATTKKTAIIVLLSLSAYVVVCIQTVIYVFIFYTVPYRYKYKKLFKNLTV